MRIPFTVEQFLEVFRRYNEGVRPAQWLLLAAGVAAVVLAMRDGRGAARAAAAILAALWLWMAVAYHLAYFRAINPVAVAFAALFVAQALLLAWLGVWRGRLAFSGRAGARADGAWTVGAVLVLYALVAYPALGYVLGHRYPAAPTFGVPCPTTIFTFGLLLWARPPVPRVLLVVPVLWSLLGVSAALQLGMQEDFGLVAAAALATLFVLAQHRAHAPAARVSVPPAPRTPTHDTRSA